MNQRWEMGVRVQVLVSEGEPSSERGGGGAARGGGGHGLHPASAPKDIASPVLLGPAWSEISQPREVLTRLAAAQASIRLLQGHGCHGDVWEAAGSVQTGAVEGGGWWERGIFHLLSP